MEMTDKLQINTFGRMAAHEVANAKGYYADEDLEVQHTPTTASKVQMQELKDGVWHFVHTHPDNVFWWNEDNDAKLLIVLALPAEPNLAFVVASDIKSYDDLRGKTIAADAAESGFVTSLRVMLKEHGLTEEGRDFYFEQIGADRASALRAGRFPASMLNDGWQRQLGDGGFHELDHIRRLYRSYANIATSRSQWATENPDLVVRYLRAHMRALLWLDDPANAAEASQLGARGGGTRLPMPPPFAWDGLREMMEIRRQAGLLRGAVDPHRFADESYYQKAVAGLG
jgi:ABC-type nitrate/sulfonate/bicarbonate transport system substrate-binding protein